MPENTPFFIIGVHRSGTTLLRFMLSSHPRLYVPPESDFIPFFFGKDPQKNLPEARMAEILRIIFTRYRFAEDWQGEPPTVSQLRARMPATTPAAFLEALYGWYAEQNQAQRWGDKTPIYASYVDVVHAIFPEAKFLHILRDPFDAGISLLEKYQKREFHIDIGFAAYNWVRRIQDAQAAGMRLGRERYLELRYEALVRNPEKEIRNVCAFLGEEFVPAMLVHHDTAQQHVPQDSYFFANVRNPIDTGSLGRGRRALSAGDRRVIQRVAGPLMLALGYPLDDLGSMSPVEEARFQFLRAKYHLLQAGRRFATALGLLPPI